MQPDQNEKPGAAGTADRVGFGEAQTTGDGLRGHFMSTGAQASSLLLRWKSAMTAAADPRLSRVDLAAHLLILNYINNATGAAWPSAETVARGIGANVRSVIRARRKLVALGHLIETTMIGKPNRYRIGTPDTRVTPDMHVTPDTESTPPLTPVSLTPDTRVTGPLTPVSAELVLMNQSKNQSKEPDKKQRTRKARAGEQIDAEESFARFWKAYPRKEAKQDAEKAWRQVDGKQHVDAILEDLERSIEARRWPEKKFTPLPATYLRGKRWTDEWEPESLTGRVRRTAEDFGNYQFGSAPAPSAAKTDEINRKAAARMSRMGSVAASFKDAVYNGTADEDLPPHLREGISQ